ncbi:MAG TPA: hypothetical protein DIU07_11590 [Rhodobacteraceae bacterium]|nr:hypothetical protein [Paracoccaceae bacterium]
MNEIKPRFEFRTWAPNFGLVEQKMRRLSACSGIRESSEIYIVSSGNTENNTKVRDKLMDIKVFVTEREGLEQWNPRMKGEFPMKTSVLEADVLPAFGLDMPALERDEYTLDQYLEEVIRPNPALSAVRVFKRRFAFTINECIAEHGEIWINGAALQTVALESVDVPAILEGKKMLGLDEYENVNYLRAIKRVIGMEPLPA